MKRLFVLLFTALIAVNSFAQQDVTKFLGIPVDGFKPAMIQKLKAKGFVPTAYDKEVLEGEFNGEKVEVRVLTNNNKVYRIAVCDKVYRDETEIKLRFNKLVRQFENNSRYWSSAEYDQKIPDDEKISYNITVDKKRYEAVFYQKESEITDSIAAEKEIRDLLSEKFTQEELENPTPEQSLEMIKVLATDAIEKRAKRCVWFVISEERYDKYSIIMFYDNEFNRSNGEDL